VACEALEGQAARDRCAAFQLHRAHPGGLTIVFDHGLVRLLAKDAAFGHHGDIKTFGDASVQFHAFGSVLDLYHGHAHARVQALRLLLGLLHPGGLQPRQQGAVGQHSAQLWHVQVAGAQPQLGFAQQRGQPAPQRGRGLRHMHLQDGLGGRCRPGLQTLQKLHAAQRQGQCARVGRYVLIGRPGIKHGDVRVRQLPCRMQRQRQPYGAGADDGQAPLGGVHGRVLRRCMGWLS
jgi:hypothetical protein